MSEIEVARTEPAAKKQGKLWAIVLAGGRGTRLRALAKHEPYIRSVANYHIGDHVYVTPISRAFWNEDHRSLIPLTRIKGRLSRPV
ncbi:MAG: hypothetical protein Q8S00_12720, partial [Deltaproteobacteria bacterium]|nr:hypothetical protein [Deltaproteobacteria bacterium]